MSKRQLSQQQLHRIDKRRHTKPVQENALLAQPALVVINSGKKALVQLKNGELHRCHQRANLSTLVAGDQVMVADTGSEWVIESLLPRRSLLSRPGFRGVIKPMAANIDQLLLVIAPMPGIDLNLLDRSLCYAEWQQLETIIILNKVDLLDAKGQELAHKIAHIYQNIGYTWLETSQKTGLGIQQLQKYCQHKTSVFVGNSGVGKSSLAQTLLPSESIRTQSLSDATGFGQHTTNNATLYDLPFGGQLIDSAGIRSLDLAEFSISQPDQYWCEFQPYRHQCRFHNCTHSHEPNCSVRKAVEDQYIHESRYLNYLKLLQESVDKPYEHQGTCKNSIGRKSSGHL
jgi:ribosome biogenesis GTPase